MGTIPNMEVITTRCKTEKSKQFKDEYHLHFLPLGYFHSFFSKYISPTIYTKVIAFYGPYNHLLLRLRISHGKVPYQYLESHIIIFNACKVFLLSWLILTNALMTGI